MKTSQLLLLLIPVVFKVRCGSVIPTKEEQVNLLTNAREVFKQVKLLVNVEANSTDESVVSDINRIVERAKDKLALLKELSILKMSHQTNAVCVVDYMEKLRKITNFSFEALDMCSEQTNKQLAEKQFMFDNSTKAADESGKEFLQSLLNCSDKQPIHLVRCYKKIIDKDVIPLKTEVLGAIDAHGKAHAETINIRDAANDCVDSITRDYQNAATELVKSATSCN